MLFCLFSNCKDCFHGGKDKCEQRVLVYRNAKILSLLRKFLTKCALQFNLIRHYCCLHDTIVNFPILELFTAVFHKIR